MTSRRRSYGSPRQLPSGRWQARYRTDDGRLWAAPATLVRRIDAERYLEKLDLGRVRGG
jgi:hypothetical protein